MNIFMFNHSGSLNRGCEAIIKGTVNIIDHSCDRNEYTLSSYAPKEDKSLEKMMKVVPFNARQLNRAQHAIAALNIRIRSDERYAVIKSYTNFFKESENADICLSVGGDTYCYGDNAVIRILTEELKKRGKKVVLWGASVGPDDLTPAKEKHLACFDAIFARESLTFDLIKSRRLNPNVFLFPDPAFTLKSDELSLPTGWQEKNTIGINVSPLVTAKNPKLMEIISGFIGYLLQHTDFSIALIPHVTSPSNNDMSVLNVLYKENTALAKGRLLLLPGDLTAAQYKGYIARMQFLIAARTHASIAAYSSGVPVIVLGYSVKSRGIAQDIFGDRRFVLDTGKLSAAKDLINAFEVLTEQEDETKNKYQKNIPDMMTKSCDAGKKLMEV